MSGSFTMCKGFISSTGRCGHFQALDNTGDAEIGVFGKMNKNGYREWFLQRYRLYENISIFCEKTL
jgi:hypothetical protein